MSGDKIPWGELPRERKDEFAALCDQFVGVETVEDAKQYYDNREKLLTDAQDVGMDE